MNKPPSVPQSSVPATHLLGKLKTFVGRKIAKRRQRHLPPSQVFADIYRLNVWKSSESISGIGSEWAQTRRLVESLPEWFARLGVQSVVDLPCGDFHWMSQVDLSGVEYIGCDIVEELIESNRKYARPGVRFQKLDVLSEPLPDADLILCRDCLVHFSFQHVRQALANIAASNARYLLATTFTERTTNTDIPTGRWRPLNLSAEPFSLPAPEATLVEECSQDDGQYADKVLGLWSIASLRHQLEKAA